MRDQLSDWFDTLVTALVVVAVTLWARPAQAQAYGPWSRPVNLGPIVNSTSNDQHPTLSKDGLTLIFASDRSGGGGFGVPGAQDGFDLWVSQRDCADPADATCQWRTPHNLTMLNTSSRDFAPNLTTDGHWLFFHSNRPGGCGGADLYATHRQNKRDDFGWEEPLNLGCLLNSSFDDAGPTFFEDGTTGALYLYFTRNDRPNTPNSDTFDIYVSTCTADLDSCNRQQLWSAGERVLDPGFNSSVRDTRTAIRRRDGLEMIISSRRCNGPAVELAIDLCQGASVGDIDLWVSTRASTQDPWSIPVNLDPVDPLTGVAVSVVNSTAIDGAPALSWDGQTLLFYSTSCGQSVITPACRTGGSGGSDLYMSTRTKLPD